MVEGVCVKVAASTCAVCEKPYTPPARTALRRETCGPDCAYRLKLMKKHNPQIEFMTRVEIRQFLTAAKREDPAYHAAFLLAINAMLKIKDLMQLRTSDLLRDPQKPCRLKVGAALIELDCETLTVVENWAANRQGKLFPFKNKRAVWKAFRKIIEAGNIYAYTFHALRHTGIMLRAKEAKNLVDQEALRKAARFGRHEQLRPYRMAEESSLVNRVKFPK